MRVELCNVLLILLLSTARGTAIGFDTGVEDLEVSATIEAARTTDSVTERETVSETEKITDKEIESEKKEEIVTTSPKLRGARQLSASTDLITGETVRTYNSNVPFVTCPIGYYRPSGSTNLHMVTGQRADGCRPCARGKYGTALGCMSCPKGTFGDRLAVTTITECHRCPPGTYGTKIGLTKSVCNSACPSGFYSTTYGNTDISSCIACPDTFQGWQCVHAIYPRSAADPDVSKWQNIEGSPAVQAVPLPKNS